MGELENKNDKDNKTKNTLAEGTVENDEKKKRLLYNVKDSNLAKFIFDNKSTTNQNDNEKILLLQQGSTVSPAINEEQTVKSMTEKEKREGDEDKAKWNSISPLEEKQAKSPQIPKPLHSFMHLHPGVKAEGLP